MRERMTIEEIIEDITRKKLLRRANRLKGILSLKDLGEVERRCRSAYNDEVRSQVRLRDTES